MKAAWGGLIVVLAVTAAACDGTTTVTAKVKSAEGTAIPDVDVSVENAPRPTRCTTDTTGACELSFLHGGWYNRYKVRISKSGFGQVRQAAWAGRRLQCRAVLVAPNDTVPSSADCE
jgi:hypothetical protein